MAYVIRDRDTQFTELFDAILESQGKSPIKLPVRASNLNAFAERWAQSVQHEALDHFIVVSESQLDHIVSEYLTHYYKERPHEGKDNIPLTGDWSAPSDEGPIQCRMRLGGCSSTTTARRRESALRRDNTRPFFQRRGRCALMTKSASSLASRLPSVP